MIYLQTSRLIMSLKVMKSLYGKRNTFNIPNNLSNIDQSRYLSQKVINVASPYFLDTIKKSRASTEQVNLNRGLNVNNNRINQISLRPEVNSKNNNNVKSNYDRILKERELKPNNKPMPINFSNSNNSNPSSEEINNRYNKIAAEREYATGNNFMHPSTIQNTNQQFMNSNISNNINTQIRNNNTPSGNSINKFNAFPQSNPNPFKNPNIPDRGSNLDINPSK